MGGMFAVIAIQAALRERERTGRGQFVKSALFESTAFLMAQHMAGQAVTGRAPPPMPAREGAWAIYDPFDDRRRRADLRRAVTSDGNGSASASISAGRILLHDPAYKTNEDRVRERPVLLPIVADIVAQHTRPSLPNCSTVSIFRSRRSPSPAICSTIRSSMPAAACSTSTFPAACTPRFRACRSRSAITISALRRQPPAIGEHTAEILAELGLARRRDRRTRGARLSGSEPSLRTKPINERSAHIVHISEEGPREGFQFEKGVIPTERKIALIDALSQTGLDHIQIVSFVNPKTVPGMADADEVVERITPRPGVAYTALWLNEKGFERALTHDDRLTNTGTIQLCTSEKFLKRNQNRTMAQQLAGQHAIVELYKANGIAVERGSIMAAFGCNFEGDIPVDARCFSGRANSRRGEGARRDAADTSRLPTPWRGRRRSPSSAWSARCASAGPISTSRCTCTTRAAWRSPTPMPDWKWA